MQRLLVSIALLALMAVTAACGGAPGTTSRPTPEAPATQGGGGGGSLDCVALRSAAEKLIGIQLLAQLSTPEVVESIRDKEVGNLDLDAMLAALDELHALDDVPSPLGDPEAAIAVYEEAAEAAKVLFAMEPVTQAAIDAFNAEHVGTVGEFLGHQVAISAALGENGC